MAKKRTKDRETDLVHSRLLASACTPTESDAAEAVARAQRERSASRSVQLIRPRSQEGADLLQQIVEAAKETLGDLAPTVVASTLYRPYRVIPIPAGEVHASLFDLEGTGRYLVLLEVGWRQGERGESAFLRKFRTYHWPSQEYDSLMELAELAIRSRLLPHRTAPRVALVIGHTQASSLSDRLEQALKGAAAIAGIKLTIVVLSEPSDRRKTSSQVQSIWTGGFQGMITWGRPGDNLLEKTIDVALSRIQYVSRVELAEDLGSLTGTFLSVAEALESPSAKSGPVQTTKAERREQEVGWEEVVAVESEFDACFSGPDESEQLRAMVFTARAKRECPRSSYDDPGKMADHLRSLGQAATEIRMSGGNVGRPLHLWLSEKFGLDYAPTDGNLSRSDRTFTFEGKSWDRQHHIKVDDARGLTQSGRIYFAIDQHKYRLIVDHIGSHLPSRG